MTYENNTSNSVQSQPTDVRQQVTNLILSQLEEGTVPWQRPWTMDKAVNLSLPRNGTTGNAYKGINIILLWSANLKHNHETCEWATFKQWSAKNERIRKGEKGSPVVYYDTIDKEVDGEIQKIPYLKKSVVFNRCQLTNFQSLEIPVPQTSLVERIERLDKFVTNTGANIIIEGSQAFYRPSEDKIVMPNICQFIDTDQCTATEGMYATLTHELTHWTGHPIRQNRDLKNRFGEKGYAEEELTAELGSAFLAAEFGLSTPHKQHHAAYIANWMKVLKDNTKCIFTAASQASKAVDYLHSLQP